MISFVRLQATPWPGLEVGDPALAVRTLGGLTELRGTSLLGTEFSLTITYVMSKRLCLLIVI